jgi:hypothetical protein
VLMAASAVDGVQIIGWWDWVEKCWMLSGVEGVLVGVCCGSGGADGEWRSYWDGARGGGRRSEIGASLLV